MINGDLSVVFDNFKGEVYTKIDKALKKAINRTAKELQQQTISNAKAGIKTYNNHPEGPNVYESENILDAVRITKLQTWYDENEMYRKVHVLGTGHANSKTFRFRFLEKGTKDRYATTKKGKQLSKPRYLGHINGRWYFKQAKSVINPLPIYEEEINKAIAEINSN